jgi:hypothetical protein
MGRRVADRRIRGRRRRREELPGGAPEEKQGDMKRWETGEDASAQQKGKDVVGVGLLTGYKFTGASWNILQPTTVNIPSYRLQFQIQGPLAARIFCNQTTFLPSFTRPEG